MIQAELSGRRTVADALARMLEARRAANPGSPADNVVALTARRTGVA